MTGAFGFTGDNYPSGPSFKPRTTGFISGAFYMFPSVSRFKTGLDGRMTFSPGYNGGKAYTGGFRVSFVPNRLPLRPYFQFGGGMASTQLNESVCSVSGCSTKPVGVSGGVVQIDAGLDIPLTRQLDIRAFEYGRDTGGSRGLTSAAVGSFSSGLVFHFGPRKVARP